MVDKNEEITKRYELYYHEEGQNIVYVGTDEPYYNTIKYKTLKPYKKVGIEFHWLNHRSYDKYEQVFIEIIRIRPVYIYIDFTVDEETIQKIGKLLTQDPVTHKVPIVAIVNNRKIAEKRVFPAIDFNRSGTRREELLTSPDELQKMWILRKIVHEMSEIDAMEFLIGKLSMTKTNDEFFDAMKRQKG